MSNAHPHRISRRAWLQAIGAGAAALPLVPLATACGGDPGTAGPDASATPDASGGDNCGPAAAAWATGGTAAMTAKACYPDPFAGGAGSCARLVCATTRGPCTAATPDRQDVSEGYPGLPVRLALRIITAETCAPVGGAVVEIWHTQTSGVYSGITPNPQLCNGNDADAKNHNYFRGAQTTDATGRVDFDTCFPGWYSGRAIHIHFRVIAGADELIVSQLFFADALTQEIFAAHGDYRPYGPPNTTNSSDGIIGGAADFAAYVLDTARMSDGAMLASKVIAIRGSLAAPNCTT